MSVRLQPWLEDVFATQLLLGHHWLQQRYELKEAGVKLEKDAVWKGLYHDNGSCLDITNDVDPQQNAYLHIVQTSPLKVCDSQFYVLARISAQCLAQLHARWPDWTLSPQRLRTTIAVRNYSIRYTAYGPPSKRLELVLHSIDWLPQSMNEAQGFNPKALKPLKSDGITDILPRLSSLRERRDRRCLGKELFSDFADATMPDLDDTHVRGSQPLTQFGTQISHPLRPQTQGNASPSRKQIIEPALANPVQSDNVQPPADSIGLDESKRVGLLSLLASINRPNQSVVVQSEAKSINREAIEQPRTNTTLSTEQPFTQLPENINRQPTQVQDEKNQQSPKPHASAQKEKRTKNDTSMTPRKGHAASETENTQQHDKRNENRLQELVSQCSWMKGFEFNREAFKVNSRQLSLLQKDESWHKPPPGKTFPAGNIPIEILSMIHRLADEVAASGAAPESDDDMDEDPSPDSILQSVNPTPVSAVDLTQVDATPSSPVSWSSTPEPPQLPTRMGEELPPDSSFETHNKAIEDDEPPLQSPRIQVESSNPTESRADISSSPPAVPKLDLDDDVDMEMEADIPRALGEDIVSPIKELAKLLTRSPSPQVRPVVQVKETPYPKYKSAQITALPSSTAPQNQTWSDASKPHSSISIVYGTYDDAKSTSRAQVRETVIDTHLQATYKPPAASDKMHAAQASSPSTKHLAVQTQRVISKLKHSPSMTSPEASPGMSDKNLSKGPSPRGHAKRQHEDSPSKKSHRHTKRRVIKYVGFGSDEPSSVSPQSALRQRREESLEKARESRRLQVSLDRRSEESVKNEAQQHKDVTMDSPGSPSDHTPLPAMSPRHESLYNEPDSKASVITLDARPSSTVVSTSVQEKMEPRESQGPPQTTSNEHAKRLAVQESPPTVFASFKAAYPEYTGDAKHFSGQCLQMYSLDLEDRMVPKWQWDDYIIRSRTDYKTHALECLDRGEDAPEYVRFYKDHVRDTLYRKNIVTNSQIVLQALKELGVELPRQNRVSHTSPKHDQRLVKLAHEKKSRRSLPGAFHTVRHTTKQHIHTPERKHPRVSLPAPTPLPKPHPKTTLPSARQNAPNKPTPASARPSKHTTESPPQPTTPRPTPEKQSDPFRDFFFAFQRTTSLTGSTAVDARLPWPRNLAVRPSIALVPREKADVLTWRDEL